MQQTMITIQDREASVFTGSVLGFWGITILAWLIGVLTLGFGIPWAICIQKKWVIEHTILDGECLGFNGNGLDLLGCVVWWILLALVTLGVYCLWIPIKFQQWLVSHTYVK